uniref:Deacetylase sirtuin-type domain-containing protein n=1 Tax=Candidozyma auris TaxID=498019 RepID=A0A0L0P7Z4_CANAR
MKSVNLLEGTSAEDNVKFHEVAKIIYKARKITALTGAGISCNAGIPDFRSDDGLYNLVKEKYPQSFIKGQDLFDISLFRNQETLLIFCTFMEGLYKHSLAAKATETHRFIKTLKEKNKLLRCYTQNIDSLEKRINLNCGINPAEFNELENGSGKLFRDNWKSLDVVQLHGNLHKLLCTQCFSHYEWTPEAQKKLERGENPECENCYLKYQERLYSGKRLTGSIGILRPDIVLYGENHPQSEMLTRGLNIDLGIKCDCLLIMGTSLKVDGVKKLVRSLAKSIHDRDGKVIFINKLPLPKQWANLVDYEILTDCDDFVRLLKKEVPDLFLTQEQLDSKRLKCATMTPKSIKKEVLHDIKTEAIAMLHKMKNEAEEEGQIKQEDADLLTPPTTPSKQRTILLPKSRPSLKRRKSSTDQRLPTPASSFCEPIKVESDSDVATDCDEETPLQDVSKSTLNRETKRICLKPCSYD